MCTGLQHSEKNFLIFLGMDSGPKPMKTEKNDKNGKRGPKLSLPLTNCMRLHSETVYKLCDTVSGFVLSRNITNVVQFSLMQFNIFANCNSFRSIVTYDGGLIYSGGSWQVAQEREMAGQYTRWRHVVTNSGGDDLFFPSDPLLLRCPRAAAQVNL